MTSVLWYSNETPDVHGQGGQRRQYFQIRCLLEAGHQVTVVSLAGEQDDTSIRSLTEVQRLPGPDRRRLRQRPAHDSAIKVFDAISRDRVVVAHIESWLHLRSRGVLLPGPRLLDLHNVFSSWYRSSGRPVVAAQWRRREVAASRSFETVSVCSPREAAAFMSSTGRDALVVPHGIDPPEWAAQPRPRDQPVLKLFGNWDWDPNRDGLAWFLERVAPRVAPALLTIEVAGRGCRDLAPPPGVVLRGRIPDVATFLSDAWVVGLPVMRGVGAPVKFAEALVTGIPVLATLDAAGRVDPCDSQGLLVSDDPEDWVRRIGQVVSQPAGLRAASRERRERTIVDQSWQHTTAPLRRWVELG